jgi:AcrR family transcriptional regulator
VSKTSSIDRAPVLEAALAVFSRYGFARTSMADIAREAGVSRPALYLWFESKPALFGALAAHLTRRALEAAESAWDPAADLETNLRATILGKDLDLHRILHASPHGAELMAVDADLTAATVKALDEGFAGLLERRIADLPDLDLSAYGGAAGFGRAVTLIAAGLKHETRDEAAYVDSVASLCRILARATRP